MSHLRPRRGSLFHRFLRRSEAEATATGADVRNASCGGVLYVLFGEMPSLLTLWDLLVQVIEDVDRAERPVCFGHVVRNSSL